MPNFIRARGPSGQLINLDHIARVKWNGHDGYDLLDRDGEKLGSVEDGDDLALDERIIPAAAGTCATIIGCYPSHRGDRPMEDDLLVERVQVVAWSISIVAGIRYAARPVIAGQPADDDHIYIERPDGKLEEVDTGTFDDIEGAKNYVLKNAQNDWDRERRLKDEKAAKAANSSPPDIPTAPPR